MKSVNKYLPFALGLAFLILGISAFFESRPSAKNERVYSTVKAYSPYYMEQRFGGIQIMSKEDPDFKEKPSNMDLFKRLETLEKGWGQKHLKIEKGSLFILDDNGSTLSSLPLLSEEEYTFIQRYYGVQ
ncbi:MAG: hypothetical protein ABXS92_01820 [Sulfurimonas sp.]